MKEMSEQRLQTFRERQLHRGSDVHTHCRNDIAELLEFVACLRVANHALSEEVVSLRASLQTQRDRHEGYALAMQQALTAKCHPVEKEPG